MTYRRFYSVLNEYLESNPVHTIQDFFELIQGNDIVILFKIRGLDYMEGEWTPWSDIDGGDWTPHGSIAAETGEDIPWIQGFSDIFLPLDPYNLNYLLNGKTINGYLVNLEHEGNYCDERLGAKVVRKVFQKNKEAFTECITRNPNIKKIIAQWSIDANQGFSHHAKKDLQIQKAMSMAKTFDTKPHILLKGMTATIKRNKLKGNLFDAGLILKTDIKKIIPKPKQMGVIREEAYKDSISVLLEINRRFWMHMEQTQIELAKIIGDELELADQRMKHIEKNSIIDETLTELCKPMQDFKQILEKVKTPQEALNISGLIELFSPGGSVQNTKYHEVAKEIFPEYRDRRPKDRNKLMDEIISASEQQG